ncbi:MAG: NUDIX domain-containing protein [Pseudomonadota bacterium]
MSENIIPAATILLLRETPQLEVLMIERHAETPFAGGAMVFPGGRIDPGDTDHAWAEHCDGWAQTPSEERAPRIAAIREAFEEAGILLASRNGDQLDDADMALLDPWRTRIEKDDALFLTLIKQENLHLLLDKLCLFARWEPPAGVTHRRYHTWFFAAPAPIGQKASEDGNEATEAVWLSPQTALDARDDGERKMIYPTSRNVELLTLSQTVDEVFENAAGRKIETISPTIIERNGQQLLTIPNHLGYPITEEPVETAFRG